MSFDSDPDGVDAIRDEHGPRYIPPRAHAGEHRESMAPRCTPDTHAAVRKWVEVFRQCTTGHQSWEGLFTGQCRQCGSTLALNICRLCGEPCSTDDALPWNDDKVHFKCAAKLALERGKTRFVILVGQSTAREFRR